MRPSCPQQLACERDLESRNNEQGMMRLYYSIKYICDVSTHYMLVCWFRVEWGPSPPGHCGITRVMLQFGAEQFCLLKE